MKNVWHQVRDDPEIVKYMPSDEMDLGRWPDRKFFWGILSTIRHDYVEEYVTRCSKQRDQMHLEKRFQCK